jgi:hypothetical protein
MTDLRMMHHSDDNVFNTSLSNTKLKSAQEKKKNFKGGVPHNKNMIYIACKKPRRFCREKLEGSASLPYARYGM